MTYVDELRELADVIDAEDSKAAAMERFASRVLAWQRETREQTGEELSFRDIDRRIDRSQDYTGRIVRWHTSDAHARQETPWRSGSNKRDEVTATTLGKADDDTLAGIVGSLPPEQVEKLVSKGTDRLVETARAQRAEHATEPTVRDLTGGEKFDPAEYWADTLVIRVNRNARELAHLVKRAGGLLFGTMPPDEAFDYLHEAERLIAEARAAAQEQVRDAVEV